GIRSEDVRTAREGRKRIARGASPWICRRTVREPWKGERQSAALSGLPLHSNAYQGLAPVAIDFRPYRGCSDSLAKPKVGDEFKIPLPLENRAMEAVKPHFNLPAKT